jgi:hypothetical protein
MSNSQILSVAHLQEVLAWVLNRHGTIKGPRRDLSGVSAVLYTDEYGRVTVRIDAQPLAELAESLRISTVVDASNDVRGFAQQMASVARLTDFWGQVVCGAGHASAEVDVLAHTVGIEFAIACVSSFARSYGFLIPDESLPENQITLALSAGDWDLLIKTFEQALYDARRGAKPAPPKHAMKESPESIISDIERRFAEATPIPQPRQLSAESFSNLRSVADEEKWEPCYILRLIEEHLTPELFSGLAYHSRTVSGDDWRRLYEWIDRGNGRVL